MRPSEIADVLTALIPTRTPLVLQGPPGCAKTSLSRQAADRLFGAAVTLSTVGGGALDDAAHFRVINAIEIDPVDTRGIPERDKKTHVTSWGETDLVPTEGQGVLCIEELPQAAPMVQNALRKLLLDRRLGKTKLGDGWSVIATGNRTEDRAGANRILTTVSSSVVFLDVDVSHEDWQAWAVSAGIIPEIRAFLNFTPHNLYKFEANQRCWPNYRSWELCSNVFRQTPKFAQLDVAGGCIGQGVAAEFVGYTEIFQQLPTPQQIVASPSTIKVPSEASVLWAISASLSEHARHAAAKVLDAIVTFALRLPEEFAVLLVRDATAVNPGLLTVPSAQKWLDKHRDTLVQANAAAA